MIVLKAPPIKFVCTSCNATCAGEPHEFQPLPTMPPTWRARCAFCRSYVTCSPEPLIAMLVGSMFDVDSPSVIGPIAVVIRPGNLQIASAEFRECDRIYHVYDPSSGRCRCGQQLRYGRK